MIDGLHAVRVPSGRGGGAARPRPRARGRPRRSDARPAPAAQAAAAPRDPLRGHREQRGRSATAPGWRASSSAGAARRRRCWTTSARSTRSCIRRDAARARRSSRWCPARRGRRPSPGCAACAGSTRSPRSGCAPRSATSSASPRAGQLMSYVGLVPVREHAPAQQRRLGAITKTGSGHARRLLVEAAWHYRQRQPRAARRSRAARAGQPAEVDRDRLERAAAPAPHLAAPRQPARQAPHDRRRRRRPRTRRLLLGDRPHRLTRTTDSTTSAGTAAGPGTRARASAIVAMSNPPQAGHARS